MIRVPNVPLDTWPAWVERLAHCSICDDNHLPLCCHREASACLKQGKRVADSVRFYIQFGSQETREYCVRKGYLDVFRKAGAQVIEPSCGACINAGPGISTRPDQVVISAQNRNFPGRSGPGQMYLASPLTVAASALAGYIVEYEPTAELVGA